MRGVVEISRPVLDEHTAAGIGKMRNVKQSADCRVPCDQLAIHSTYMADPMCKPLARSITNRVTGLFLCLNEIPRCSWNHEGFLMNACCSGHYYKYCTYAQNPADNFLRAACTRSSKIVDRRI